MSYFLYRNNKIEFEGNYKELVEYLNTAYIDSYWMQEYGKLLLKDKAKLYEVIENLGFSLTTKKGRSSKNKVNGKDRKRKR